MKPIIAPFLFPAAVFMASACAPVSVAAAMDGSRSMAVRCACLMSSASSSGRLMGFMAMETTCRPRSSPHLARERLVHERRKLLGVGGQGARADLQLGDAGKGGLQRADELRLEHAVDLGALVVALDIAAHMRVEQHGVGNFVGIHAVAADGHVDIQPDVAVDDAEGDRGGRAELVVHDLLGIEVVNALVLARVSAEGEAAAYGLERIEQALAE